MIHIFILLTILFLPILSFNEIKQKLCINCKYFITDNDTNKFAKCSLFPKKDENDIFMLVNGIREYKNIEYYHCSVLRDTDTMCGKEGKMYKPNDIFSLVNSIFEDKDIQYVSRNIPGKEEKIYKTKYLNLYYYTQYIMDQPQPSNEITLLDVQVEDENIALNLMVSFLHLAQKRGAFTIDESAKIWECIHKFKHQN